VRPCSAARQANRSPTSSGRRSSSAWTSPSTRASWFPGPTRRRWSTKRWDGCAPARRNRRSRRSRRKTSLAKSRRPPSPKRNPATRRRAAPRRARQQRPRPCPRLPRPLARSLTSARARAPSSEDALAVARENAARHGIAVTFLQGDLGAPLAAFAPFDLITANLPYIPTGDLPGLDPEVRAEPRLALDGGADGLALVQRLVRQAPPLLAAGGALVLEIGAGQAPATVALLQGAGFIDVRRRRDLGAIDRVVSGVKP
jgi:hypothetical protein